MNELQEMNICLLSESSLTFLQTPQNSTHPHEKTGLQFDHRSTFTMDL